jgi:hypothetical protein
MPLKSKSLMGSLWPMEPLGQALRLGSMHKTSALILLALLITACAGGAPSPSPLPSPVPSPVPSPNPSPQPSPSPTRGFYLRAWYTQALPPPSTFNWLPPLTITDGVAIDGNVAIPAMYPGPMLIIPVGRSISDAGIAAIVDEARRFGLLGDATDFTGGTTMPGSRTGHLRLIVDGVTYDLVGNPDVTIQCIAAPCEGAAGSPEAFAAFWQELTMLDPWIASELGPSRQYHPERVALMLTEPAHAEQGLQQQLVAWPLDKTFAETGVDYPGQTGARCVTLSGDDLETLLPLLLAANQLTVFTDSDDAVRSAVAVVLVPGEESPCPDEA